MKVFYCINTFFEFVFRERRGGGVELCALEIEEGIEKKEAKVSEWEGEGEMGLSSCRICI